MSENTIESYTVSTELFTIEVFDPVLALSLCVIHAPADLTFPKGKLRIHDKDNISVLELQSGNAIQTKQLTKIFFFLSNPDKRRLP